ELAVRRGMAWSVGFAALFTGLYVLAGERLIDWLTGLPEVRETAHAYLPWLLVSPLGSVWSFFYDGVYVGAVRTREMRTIMLVSAFGVFLPVWWLASDFGNHAIWMAFLAFMAARGLGMHLAFRQLLASGRLV